MDKPDARAALERLIADNGDDYASLSKLIGRNPAYIQQYMKRGTPKKLPERERAILARYYGVDEKLLGALESVAQRSGLRLVPKLAVGASAGPGAIDTEDMSAGKIGFDEKWLKSLANDPAALSMIRVSGDSMAPTLEDGEDIMVDASAAKLPLRDGIHIIRMDDELLVKRLARGPGGRLSILSDNPTWPDWEDVMAGDVSVIGRVVWAGRRL